MSEKEEDIPFIFSPYWKGECEKILRIKITEEEKKDFDTPFNLWVSRTEGLLPKPWKDFPKPERFEKDKVLEYIHSDKSKRVLVLEKNTIPRFQVNEKINSKIFYCEGDISKIKCDAILNAANEGLLGGGGIDGAIHKTAGRLLQRECALMKGKLLPVSCCHITKGYNLPSRYVIHGNGPIFGENKLESVRISEMKNMINNVLECCLRNNIKSVCLCPISTGFYGYPLHFQVKCSFEVIRTFLEKLEMTSSLDRIEKIIFCCYSHHDKITHSHYLPIFFPRKDDYF